MIKTLAIALGLTFSLPAFAESSEKPAATEANVSADVKAGTGVEKRQIVGEAASFTKGTTVWVWSQVSNGPATIKHVWKLDGKPVWTATLPVKSKKWSTQSRRTMTKPGNWEVEVTAEDGTSLGKVAFSIAAS